MTSRIKPSPLFLRSLAAAAPLVLTLLATPDRAGASEAPTTLRGLAEAAASTATDPRALRRLPSTLRSARLTGETDAVTLPIWLTAAEAARGAKLRLVHTVAVSVMPEASRLTLAVNDRPLSETAIGAGGGSRTTEVALPAGMLQAGWNAVRIGVDQRHRVDCSVASTFELWSEIDRARSGLVFAAGHKPERRGIADIAGLAPDDHGRVAIRLITGNDAEPRQLERAFRAAQALALIGGFLDPIVTVGRRADSAPGIDLVIGRAATGLDGEAGSLQSGSIAVLDDGDLDRLTVVLPGDDAAVDRAIAQLAEMARAPGEGSAAGLEARTAVGGRAVASGERLRLADVGAQSTEFSGRLFRTGFDLRLPADLYAADYGKVQLKLAGGHAPGLDRTSRLTVRVNGRQAVGAPIAAPRGEVFTDRTLAIPLSAFRPGHNRIEIEASVPSAADKSCDAAVQIEGAKRFLFVDRSELVFPRFARLARLPDLAATAGGVLGRLAPEAQPVVHLPRPDASALAAAATLVTRMGIASGRVEPVRLAFRNPPVDAPSAMVIGALPDLPATVIGAVGLEASQVRSAWSRRPAVDPAAPTPGPTAALLDRRVAGLRLAGRLGDVDPIVTGSLSGRVLTTPPADDGDLVDRWRRSMESPWSPAAVSRHLGIGAEKLVDLLPSFGTTRPLEGFAPTPSTGLVMAQAMAQGGAWTLVTAPTSAMLADAVTTVTGGESWTRLQGAAATWDQVEETVSTVPAGHVGFLATLGFDFANLRLVAAALASDYPFVYVLAALLVTGLLGFATARLLPHVARVKA